MRAALFTGLLAVGCFAALPARSLEISCIEASKYKYLFHIFDNDPQRMADYLKVGKTQIPDPEMCRAYLVVGSVEPLKDTESDFDKLLTVLTANRGWLTTLYLGSRGGHITMGLRLGELTRMFWLKTHAIETREFDYVPDFFGSKGPGSAIDDPPPELRRGWEAYLAETKGIPAPRATGRGRCASSCSYLHVAGIDRYGRPYVHRPRQSKRKGESGSMADMLESLHRSEARVIAFYRKMDAGSNVIRLFQSTPTATTVPVDVPRSPRHIYDYLRQRCKAPSNVKGDDREDWTTQCFAASHERERRDQFAKLCPNGCDRKTILRELNRRVRALAPESRRKS